MSSRFILGLLGSVLCGACGVAPAPDANDESVGSASEAVHSHIGRSAWLYYDGSRVIEPTSYNSTNPSRSNSVAREGTGMYKAVLPGMWSERTVSVANVQISVVEHAGYTAAFCSTRVVYEDGPDSPDGQDEMHVLLSCYDRKGAPANAAFYLSNLDWHKPPPVFFNPSSTGVLAEIVGLSSTCQVLDKFAPGQHTCTRLGKGNYRVRLVGQSSTGGTVYLTASQNSPQSEDNIKGRYCNVERQSTTSAGTDVDIRCFAGDGDVGRAVPIDTRLYFQYRRKVMENQGGFVRADHPELDHYLPSSIYNDRAGACATTLEHDIYVDKVTPSKYLVTYPTLGALEGPKAVHTTPYGSSEPNFCRLSGEAFRPGADPDALSTQVNCYSTAGARTPSKFMQLALVNSGPACNATP